MRDTEKVGARGRQGRMEGRADDVLSLTGYTKAKQPNSTTKAT